MNRLLNTHRWILPAFAVALFLATAFPWAVNQDSLAFAASSYSQEIARVGATQGDAKVQRAGEAQFKKVASNEPLYLMDFLSTARNSKVWWKGSEAAWWPHSEATHGSLGENAIFGFADFRKSGTAAQFVGQVNNGIVRFIKKLPMTDPPSRFAVTTPTALSDVMPTDRAADFVVETVDDSRTTVTVIWGKVKVRSISDQFKEERVLTSCQEVDVEKDKEPGEIRWVSSDTMKNLIKRTTIPNTLPTDVPSCERIKTEVIQRPGAVFVPPPGIVVVPIPTPPPPKDCPCPPGSYIDPATNQCACCPQGRMYDAAKCDCGCPCPPNHEYDPTFQQCVPCRQGSVNGPLSSAGSSSCRCSCPCPEGQVLLPGRGCVPNCPLGFSVLYDTSEGLPHRCPVCVQSLTGGPPPPQVSCDSDMQCGRCETCVQGNCVRRTCPEGQTLNLQECGCVPLVGRQPPGCREDTQCPACQRCQDGSCVPAVTCPLQQRLNLSTCQCEGFTTLTTPTGEEPQCKSNSDCDQGERCRKGKCVKKPPVSRRPQEPMEEPTFTDQTDESYPISTRPIFPGPGFGTGIGIGGGGGGPGPGSRGGGQTVRPPTRGKPN